MPARRKKKPQQSPPAPLGRRLLRCIGALFACLLIYMLIEGSSVRLMSSQLTLRGLPADFEGTRVL